MLIDVERGVIGDVQIRENEIPKQTGEPQNYGIDDLLLVCGDRVRRLGVTVYLRNLDQAQQWTWAIVCDP